MGSQSKEILAYIAGFLDGDGSLMLQLKKRNDAKLKFRFMATICFYQDSRHAKPLYWIRQQLGIGYISIRQDGITELRINGFKQVQQILVKLLPYIRFKKIQAEILLQSCNMLSHQDVKPREIIKYMTTIQKENYKSSRRKSQAELLKILGLTP